MVGKTYLRYVVGPQGGSITSSAALTVDSTIVQPQYRNSFPAHNFVRQNATGRRFGNAGARNSGTHNNNHHNSNNKSASTAAALFVPSLEAVRVLSVRSGALMHTLVPAEAKMPLEVTSLRVMPLTPSAKMDDHHSAGAEGWMLLVGYNTGAFAVFTCSETNNYGKPVCRFYALGHRVDTSVLALAADPARMHACSAGQDTDVTVWDLASQEAAYRLRGHRGGVVALEFAPNRPNDDPVLISAAADGLVKVWSLGLRQCVQTVVASDAQVTSMVMDRGGQRLFCGVRESYIRVYKINDNNTDGSSAAEAGRRMAIAPAPGSHGGVDDVLVDHGIIERKYHKPITAFSFSPDWRFMLATTSRTVEVFRVLTSDEVKRKVYRKKRRQQRSGGKTGGNKSAAAAGDDSANDDGDEPEGVVVELDEEKTEKKSTAVSGKKRERGEDADDDKEEPAEEEEEPLQTAAEEFTLLRTFFITSQSQVNRKVRSATFIPRSRGSSGAGAAAGGDDDDDTLHIAVTFNNNSIQTYTTALTLSDAVGGATWALEDLKPRLSFDQQGHQSDIRALAFVENDTALLSMSREKVLLWTVTVKEGHLSSDHTDAHDFYESKEANLARVDFKGSLNCAGCVLLGLPPATTTTTTAAAGDGVAMAAISANVCCVGLSDGSVTLLDVASSETIFAEAGFHIGGVKGVTRRPDDSGFLSLGADRRLVLWTVGLLKDGRTPTLILATEIELTEQPLFASFSPDNRYLGVGLQNNNIQLFFADSMKPYLSLFGHKLPPTAISFSDDGTLAASVGTDKALRFWGTDFGDCHRAIHAHDDYITAVEFVRDTHYVFTVSLDGSVKHWDGDNWTMIQYIRQHQHGLWAVSVTRNATCVATAGADKCIRCFLRTEEIIFPEEEEERMGQEAMDEEAARRAAMQSLDAAAAPTEVGVASQQTPATAEAAERLMEALDLVSVELQRRDNPEDANPKHPLLATMNEWEYLWSVIASVRPSEMRHALASFTTVHVDALLNYLGSMIEARAVLDYEIAAKIVLGLVMPSAAAAAAGGPGGAALALRTAAISGEASEVIGARRLARLRRLITDGLDRSVARTDYNVGGLQFVRQHLQDTETMRFFDRSKIQGHKKKYHSRALPTGKAEE